MAIHSSYPSFHWVGWWHQLQDTCSIRIDSSVQLSCQNTLVISWSIWLVALSSARFLPLFLLLPLQLLLKNAAVTIMLSLCYYYYNYWYLNQCCFTIAIAITVASVGTITVGRQYCYYSDSLKCWNINPLQFESRSQVFDLSKLRVSYWAIPSLWATEPSSLVIFSRNSSLYPFPLP